MPNAPFSQSLSHIYPILGVLPVVFFHTHSVKYFMIFSERSTARVYVPSVLDKSLITLISCKILRDIVPRLQLVKYLALSHAYSCYIYIQEKYVQSLATYVGA